MKLVGISRGRKRKPVLGCVGVPVVAKRKSRSSGYMRVRLANGRIMAEHRYVMSNYLGRELVSTEVIHHIDEHKTNNSIENLQVLTASEHSRIHARKNFARRGVRYVPKNEQQRKSKG